MRLNGGSENRRGRAGCSRAAISSTRSLSPGEALGRASVELEHNPQRDDFAFCPGQLCKRVLELGGETFAEARRRHLAQLADRVTIFPPQPPRLRPKVVERGRACELAEPRAGPASPRIETAEAPQRALEGLDREVFGEVLVGGQVHEVAKDVVEVLLGDGGEALLLRVHDLSTSQTRAYVTAATTAAS